jgi:hypothetical protein
MTTPDAAGEEPVMSATIRYDSPTNNLGLAESHACQSDGSGV